MKIKFEYFRYLQVLSGIGNVWLCGCKDCQTGFMPENENRNTTSEALVFDCLYSWETLVVV